MAKFNKTKNTLNNKDGKPAVYLIRHGSTALNNSNKDEDRIRGHVDVPLNDQGREDAKNAAENLKKIPASIIYSSDLSRARETADIVNRYHHVPIVDMTELRPWDLGSLQGRITNEVIGDINRLIVNEDQSAPNGESFKTFRTRYLSALKKIMDQSINKSEKIFVTTHLRNLKIYDGWAKNGFPDDFTVDTDTVSKDEFHPGEICVIDLKRYMKR